MMLETAEALVAKNRTVNGKSGMSLCDLGYCSVGVDEGWEQCGGPDVAPGMEQHDAKGNPTIQPAFPDMKKMVDSIHDLGLKAGWCVSSAAFLAKWLSSIA